MQHSDNILISPCIRKCCLNDNDVCLGCFRSLPEITGWSQADEHTRLIYLDQAQQRRLAYEQKYELR